MIQKETLPQNFREFKANLSKTQSCPQKTKGQTSGASSLIFRRYA